MKQIRACELQVGDLFLHVANQYVVLKITETEILYKPAGSQSASATKADLNLNKFGRNSQMWVEKTGTKNFSVKL